MRYRDPNTRGEVVGRDALRRYLTRLLAEWQMTWDSRETFTFDGTDGGAFLLRAGLRRVGSERTVEIEGMDLAVLRGGKVARNEVYFDRSRVA